MKLPRFWIYLLAFGTTCGAALAQPSYKPTSSIKALQAYGALSLSIGHAFVSNYHENGLGGGGMFDWEPGNQQRSDGCIVFSATGVSAGRWVRRWTAPFTVQNCGAIADGKIDNTAAMDNAGFLGFPIYYPAGIYRFSRITIKGGGIVGDGTGLITSAKGATILSTTDTSNADIVTVSGIDLENSSPIFRDFSIIAPRLAKKAGAALSFAPANTARDQSHRVQIMNIVTRYIPIGVEFQNSDAFNITNSFFYYYADAGVNVSGPKNPDMGDGTISGSTFFNGADSAYASIGRGIYQRSAGGLRITNNKFNSGNAAYFLDLAETTSDLLFTGNSVENLAGTAVRFSNQANTVNAPVRFLNVVIASNQFSNNQVDISFDQIANFAGSSYWDNISISGNVFYHTDVQHNSIQLYSARAFTISGNAFNGNGVGFRSLYLDRSTQGGQLSANPTLSFARPPEIASQRVP